MPITWKNRYLVSASLRADGDSRFGPNNRWAKFPAISAGWLISDEPFMGNFKEKFGQLKLRGSYGETGKQTFRTSAISRPSSTVRMVISRASRRAPLRNPTSSGKTTKEWDGGLDWTPFSGRISLIADYYHKKTSDLIVDRPILGVSGYTDFFDNIGEVGKSRVGSSDSTLKTSSVDCRRIFLAYRLQHLVQSQRGHEAER